MIKRTSTVLTMLASLAFASSAFAQDSIEATLVSEPTFSDVIRPAAADLSFRYYYMPEYTGDTLTSDAGMQQIRTNLTFKVLKTIDSTFILAANRTTGSQQLTQRRPRVWSEATLYGNEVFTLNAYNYLALPFGGAPTQADLGLNPTVSFPLPSAIGQFTLLATVRADAKFKSRDGDYTVAGADERMRSGLGLVDEDKKKDVLKGGQNDPAYQLDSEAFVKFTPAADPKLSLAVGMQHDRNFKPEYTYDENDLTSRELSYNESVITVSRVKLDYQVTEAVKLTNDFYYQTEGFYAARVNGVNPDYGPRIMNLTYLTYKFF